MEQDINWLVREKYNGVYNKEKIAKDLKKISEGEPMAYVIGSQPFLNIKVDLSFKPLIPRPETEFWTEKVIEEMKKSRKKKIEILDLFSGSGCIGLAVLKNVKNAFVDFVDISSICLKQIKKNIDLNKLDKKGFRVMKSDLFSKLERVRYDYILANPPYIPFRDFKNGRVEKTVLDHEPILALKGGEKGTEIIKKFLTEAPEHLLPCGKIFLEFGRGQAGAVTEIAKEAGFKSVKILSDQYGVKRWGRII